MPNDLFEDPDELDAREAREASLRLNEEISLEKAFRKADQRGERAAAKVNRKRREKGLGVRWYHHLFGLKRKEIAETFRVPDLTVPASPAVPPWIVKARQRDEKKKRERAEEEARRRRQDERTYDVEEVDQAFDSSFYGELGFELTRTGELIQRSQIRGSRENSSDESDVGVF
jgi:hypothetical protein